VQVQKQQTALEPRLPLHSRHCQLSAYHFRARSRFLRTVCPVAAPGFELVALAAVGRMKEVGHEVGHRAGHEETVAAAVRQGQGVRVSGLTKRVVICA
jgi:hypothetical protein